MKCDRIVKLSSEAAEWSLKTEQQTTMKITEVWVVENGVWRHTKWNKRKTEVKIKS